MATLVYFLDINDCFECYFESYPKEKLAQDFVKELEEDDDYYCHFIALENSETFVSSVKCNRVILDLLSSAYKKEGKCTIYRNGDIFNTWEKDANKTDRYIFEKTTKEHPTWILDVLQERIESDD